MFPLAVGTYRVFMLLTTSAHNGYFLSRPPHERPFHQAKRRVSPFRGGMSATFAFHEYVRQRADQGDVLRMGDRLSHPLPRAVLTTHPQGCGLCRKVSLLNSKCRRKA